jgi:hypothetical protein
MLFNSREKNVLAAEALISPVTDGLLCMRQTRTKALPELSNCSLPNAVSILADLAGIDDPMTEVNNPETPITGVIPKELIPVDGGHHD